jgi:hypothetical protein
MLVGINSTRFLSLSYLVKHLLCKNRDSDWRRRSGRLGLIKKYWKFGSLTTTLRKAQE